MSTSTSATSEPTVYPAFIAGEATSRVARSAATIPVLDKHTGETFARAASAQPAEVERAIAAAEESRAAMAALDMTQRAQILESLAEAVRAQREEAVGLLIREAGKCRKDAAVEADRCAQTFAIAADAARHGFGGDGASRRFHRHLPETHRARVARAPIGVCGFITPFNFPLNLTAHKIAPAILAGCPFVLKPSDKAPLCALFLGGLLAEAEALPKGGWSVFATTVEHSSAIVEDRRIAFFSFTGSDEVGWELQRRSAARRVALELGGDAACVIAGDLTPAQLDQAASRVTAGAFTYAGQSCISTQRVLVHESAFDAFVERLLERVAALRGGDPYDEATAVGPLIDAAAADRVESWVRKAKADGATIHTPFERRGNVISPTVVSGAPPETPLAWNEIFGPVVVLSTYRELDEAIERVNASPFGLQAGVFSSDEATLERFAEEVAAGGVVLNDVPSTRFDAMPYGGLKRSGVGREGPEFAAEEMTETKLILSADMPC